MGIDTKTLLRGNPESPIASRGLFTFFHRFIPSIDTNTVGFVRLWKEIKKIKNKEAKLY